MPGLQAQPTLAQLRPVLVLALETATSAGVPLPGRVRNLVRNRRLPANWAVTMRQALEEDEGFRAAVAAAAAASSDEERLGRLAWLWLTRPDGWLQEVGQLVEDALEADEAEKVLRRAQERIVELESELARARAESLAASSTQDGLVSSLEERRRAVASLERRLQHLTDDRADLAAQAAAAKERAEALDADNGRLLRDLQQLRARLSEMDVARAAALDAAGRAEAQRSALEEKHHRIDEQVLRLRLSVGAAVSRAASAARDLGDALAEAADALEVTGAAGGSTPAEPSPPSPSSPTATVGGRPAPHRDTAPNRDPAPNRDTTPPGRRPSPARRPLPLPPAVFDDSPEAAAYLVRAPGVHLVVDGYNVTFTSWTGDDLPALRHRLVTALSELAVRVKRTVTVVFDGTAEGGRVAPPAVARPWLRIVFTASTVEADEVIVDAVRALSPDIAVVVATDDRQVRRDAGLLGANVLSVEQLLGVLGRQGDGGR